MEHVVVEYKLVDGTTAPAIACDHPHTAQLLNILFQLLDRVPREADKVNLVEKMYMVYREILDNPLGKQVTSAP